MKTCPQLDFPGWLSSGKKWLFDHFPFFTIWRNSSISGIKPQKSKFGNCLRKVEGYLPCCYSAISLGLNVADWQVSWSLTRCTRWAVEIYNFSGLDIKHLYIYNKLMRLVWTNLPRMLGKEHLVADANC